MSSPEPIDDEDEKVHFVPLTDEILAEIGKRAAEDQAAKKKESALEDSKTEKNEDDSGEATDPDIELEAGNILPASLKRRFPVALTGRPLKEIDPFYESKETFVVINQRRKLYRFGVGKVLWFMDPLHIIRRLALRITTHPIFRFVMNLIIIANCLMMICNENKTREAAKRVFVSIYTLEFLLYFLAKGFVLHPFSYLRDPWHCFDLIVLLLDYIHCSYLPMRVYFGVLRAVRLLRLMGTTTAVPGMKNIIQALYYSTLNLRDTFIVATLPLVIFALVALQVYMGIFTQVCVPDDKKHNMTYDDAMNIFYADGAPEPKLCGNASGSGMCPDNHTCLHGIGLNPNYGFTNFDTYGWSLFNTFRLLTLDFWEDVMFMIIRSAGPWHFLYFLLLIFFGRYFIQSLVVTVLTLSYGELMAMHSLRREMEAAQYEAQRQAVLADIQEEVHEDNRVLDHTVTTPVLETEDEKEYDKKKVPSSPLDKLLQRFCVWECCDCWKKFQGLLRLVAYDAFTELCLALCIIISTLILAMDHHNMTYEVEKLVRCGTNAFAIIFAIEIVVKIMASSPYNCFKEWRHVFEFVVLLVTIPTLCVENPDASLVLTRLLGILRACRLFRIFRIAKASARLNCFINIAKKCIFPFSVLILFFFIVAFMFAVMGVELFSEYFYEYRDRFPGGDIPRWNFTDFAHAFLVVYRALCGEWVESMWEVMLVSGWLSLPFFLPLAVICNVLVLVIFFTVVFLEKDCPVVAEDQNDIAIVVDRFRRLLGRNTATIIPEDVAQTNGSSTKDVDRPASNRPASKSMTSVELALEEVVDSEPKSPSSASQKLPSSPTRSTGSKREVRNGDHAPGEDGSKVDESSKAQDVQEEVNPCCPDMCYQLPGCCNYSVWKSWTRVRQLACKIIDNRVFGVVMILCVIATIIVLAFDDLRLEDNPEGQKAVENVIIVLEVVFIVEMIIKWLALGFKSYFTSGWCLLEFTVIVISLAIFISSGCPAGFTIKAFQSLRPLRLLPRLHGLRIDTTALIRSIPLLLCSFFFCFIIWLVFSMIGVSLFGGKFAHCVDQNGQRINATIIGNRTHCSMYTEYSWLDADVHFNNAGSGFLALLQIATLKGWIQIIYNAMDSRHEKELQPIDEGNMAMFLYFVVFTIVGCFFTFSLINTLVIAEFLEQKKKLGGSLTMFMTETQKNYYNSMKEMGRVKPHPPAPSFCCAPQAAVYRIVTNWKFDVAITICFTLYLVVLACEHFGMDETSVEIITIIHTLFMFIFVAECAIKIFGLGLSYFKDGWNVFDLIVVLLAVIGTFLHNIMAMYVISQPILLRLIKIFRVNKVKNLLRAGSRYTCGIRTILTALGTSLPAMFNIALLQFIILDVYTLFGVYLFKHIKHSVIFDETLNFETFGGAIILLFQISTTAGWDGLLLSLMNEECKPGQGDGAGYCGSSTIAVIYIISYVLIMFLVIVQLYIAVVMHCYNEACEQVQEGLTTDDYEGFHDVWQKYDPNGTLFIKCDDLNNLLAELQDPFRISKPNKYKIVNMSIPIYEGNLVRADDVMGALTKDFLARRGENVDALLGDESDERGTERYGKKIVSSTLWNQREECSAQVIQRNWKSYSNNKTDEFQVVPISPDSRASSSQPDDSKLIEIAE